MEPGAFHYVEISHQSFSRNILTTLHLKFETSAHVKIAITCYYILFTNF